MSRDKVWSLDESFDVSFLLSWVSCSSNSDISLAIFWLVMAMLGGEVELFDASTRRYGINVDDSI